MLSLHPSPALGSLRRPPSVKQAWPWAAAYARFSVWKTREICSMTGPVSGSFIHWVLLSGFSSMSSKASNVLGLVSPSCTTGLSRMA